jgi:tetratricopeptide (TPR) repeat protein
MPMNGHKGDRMRLVSGLSLTVAAALVLAAVGCGKMGELKARKNYKEANQAYAQQDYKRASELYELTLQADPDDPSLANAYFYLGNSYDNLYKPSKKGDPANDELLAKAIQNYQQAAERLSKSSDKKDKERGNLSMKFLVAAFGPDKLNDPAKAEPVVQRMIQLDPGETENYFMLAKIYDDAGAYENEEEVLLKAKEIKPNDPLVYMNLAGHYKRQGQTEKMIKATEDRAAREPNNPEAHYTVATFYWDEAFRDTTLKENQKREYLQKGIAEIDKAIQIKPDYSEALVIKGLLLRLQANMEKDQSKQAELIKEAKALADKAEDLRKKKAAGVTH